MTPVTAITTFLPTVVCQNANVRMDRVRSGSHVAVGSDPARALCSEVARMEHGSGWRG